MSSIWAVLLPELLTSPGRQPRFLPFCTEWRRLIRTRQAFDWRWRLHYTQAAIETRQRVKGILPS